MEVASRPGACRASIRGHRPSSCGCRGRGVCPSAADTQEEGHVAGLPGVSPPYSPTVATAHPSQPLGEWWWTVRGRNPDCCYCDPGGPWEALGALQSWVEVGKNDRLRSGMQACRSAPAGEGGAAKNDRGPCHCGCRSSHPRRRSPRAPVYSADLLTDCAGTTGGVGRKGGEFTSQADQRWSRTSAAIAGDLAIGLLSGKSGYGELAVFGSERSVNGEQPRVEKPGAVVGRRPGPLLLDGVAEPLHRDRVFDGR